MMFVTESGSEYQTRRTPWDYEEIRRVNPGTAKRADGDWVRLVNLSDLVVGLPAWIVMESLSDYGPDDHGAHCSPGVTTRMTTPITRIER